MGVYEALPRSKKIQELERALCYIGTMVTVRDDGDRYVGLYETLEAELASLEALDETKERIRQRLAQRPKPLAA